MKKIILVLLLLFVISIGVTGCAYVVEEKPIYLRNNVKYHNNYNTPPYSYRERTIIKHHKHYINKNEIRFYKKRPNLLHKKYVKRKNLNSNKYKGKKN